MLANLVINIQRRPKNQTLKFKIEEFDIFKIKPDDDIIECLKEKHEKIQEMLIPDREDLKLTIR
jgi:hypothetical protein